MPGGIIGKRSEFERKARDWYISPYQAVLPLLPHLEPETRFIEPCAGNGALIDHLTKHGHKVIRAWDIEPQREDIRQADALNVYSLPLHDKTQCYITNPPWSRDILHKLINHWVPQHPCWLLLDADYAHTKQAREYMKLCSKIVAVGRLKWIPESQHTGKDNCCWYLFEKDAKQTVFYGRV